MKKAIFERKDFVLCEVPTPVGYPQSQTHVGISCWAGKYYMTTSPFPNIKYGKYVKYLRIIIRKLSRGIFMNCMRADYYENPCVYVEEEKQKGVPSRFRLLTPKPLMECPDDYYGYPSYNSDPDLFIEEGTAYILNRSVFPTSNDYSDPKNPYPAKVRIFMIKGQLIDGHFFYESTNLIKEWSKPYASPCMTKYKGKYIMTYIDSNSANDGISFGGIYLGYADTPENFAQKVEFTKVSIKECDLLPWHMSLFHYENRLYTIIACVVKGNKEKIWQMMGAFSEDLKELHIYPNPLTDYNSYRGAAYVNENGTFVLYTPTVHEYVKRSKAVDGRNVLVVAKSFEELLKDLSEEKIEFKYD